MIKFRVTSDNIEENWKWIKEKANRKCYDSKKGTKSTNATNETASNATASKETASKATASS